MKKCWNMNPDNRPNSIEVEESILSFYNFLNKESIVQNHEIEKSTRI